MEYTVYTLTAAALIAAVLTLKKWAIKEYNKRKERKQNIKQALSITKNK